MQPRDIVRTTLHSSKQYSIHPEDNPSSSVVSHCGRKPSWTCWSEGSFPPSVTGGYCGSAGDTSTPGAALCRTGWGQPAAFPREQGGLRSLAAAEAAAGSGAKAQHDPPAAATTQPFPEHKFPCRREQSMPAGWKASEAQTCLTKPFAKVTGGVVKASSFVRAE